MTNPIAIVYPLDLTGINPNNQVVNEPHTLENNANRAFVPNYGPFYTKGLVITDQATGLALTKTTQYVCAQLQQDVSLETGLEVMGVIVITDPSVSNNVAITYQVVGGDYAYSTNALIQMLDALQLDNRSVTWGQILGAPTLFPPTQHLHDIGDTYGWEYIVDALETLKQAILVSDQAAIGNMKNYIDAGVAQMTTTVNGFNSVLTAHIANTSNPHQVTAAQIGLGNVQNYGVATPADVATGTANDLYVTPYALAGQTSSVSSQLQAHIANHSNPHAVTQAQVGLGNVQNYGVAQDADGVAGTATNLYMTPHATTAAITSQAYTPLNNAISAHIANKSNPHAVTSAQVGLGNVANYGIASTAGAQAGVDNASYMTPALTKSAITSQVGAMGFAKLNTEVNFTSVHLNNDPAVFLYVQSAGTLNIRTGTASAPAYSYISPTGRFMSADGFQKISDRRLKSHIKKAVERPLWRDPDWKSWIVKSNGRPGLGYVAQELLKFYPEFVGDFVDGDSGKKRYSVDNTAMALEMAACAGKLVDRLTDIVSRLSEKVEKQSREIARLKAKV